MILAEEKDFYGERSTVKPLYNLVMEVSIKVESLLYNKVGFLNAHVKNLTN